MPLIERVLERQACESLADYIARGGGRGLEAARRLGPDWVVDEVEASGLRGRGGAGFPTGVKWRTVRAARSPVEPITVVVNGAEGEPGTFKDRALLRINPYKILEGALIAAFAMEATQVVVGIKRSFEHEDARLRTAIDEITAEGWCAGVDIRVVEGPDEYLFGEETALLEVIDGRAPFPRVTPPYRRGVENAVGDAIDPDGGNPASTVELAAPGGTGEAPALVDNVETLANVPGILAEGADWFRSIGTAGSPGTLICTMSGRCERHAIGEVAMGTPLREAIELIGGGALEGQRIIGAMSGVANPIVPEHLLDTPLTYEAMSEIGSGLGAGGFFVFDDTTDLVAVAYAASRFLAVESCGQCEPCKRDGLSIAERLRRITFNEAEPRDLEEIPVFLDTVTDGARCYLATQQERVVRSALQLFPDAFAAHLRGDAEPASPPPIVPIIDIEGDQAVLNVEHLRKQPDWSYDEIDSGAFPAARFGSEMVETEILHPELPIEVTDSISPRAPGPDPLKPLYDMHRDIRSALDRVVDDTGSRRDDLEVLRRRMALHDDVMRRVVHPMARRYGGAAGDDATWSAEADEADAEARLRRLGLMCQRADVPDTADDELSALVDDVHTWLDHYEREVIQLLRDNMDSTELGDLGNAIHEACATSHVNV